MTSPKRILCISRAYGENAGGMERLSFELISELEHLPSFEVTKLVYETKPGRSLFSARLQSILFAVSVLPKALATSNDVDIVHLGDPVLSLIGWCIHRIRKIPVVVTVHGLDVAYANPLYQFYLTLFFQTFSTYIAISDYAKTLLEKRTLSGDVLVIPPGIRDQLYDDQKTREDLSRMIGRDISGRIVLATTGRLVKRKGHAWFIQHVIPKLPANILYVVAGSGPEAENLSSLVQSLKLENQVLMLGRISNDDQKILLNTIDAFIQPNIIIENDAEGFGLAPLEAALCARVVFASQIDGIPSAIHDGKNGTLVPANDAAAWIDALTACMRASEASRNRPEARAYTLATFNWKVIASRYAETFGGVISKHAQESN